MRKERTTVASKDLVFMITPYRTHFVLLSSPLTAVQHHPHGQGKAAVDALLSIPAHVEHVSIEDGVRAAEFAEHAPGFRIAEDEIQAQ